MNDEIQLRSRSKWLEEHGWKWEFLPKEPKEKPRRLFSDEFALMRPQVRREA